MYCPFCGTDNAADQKYCRNCGATLPTSVAKPPTKAHKPVPTSNPRPSGPFVPPAPPSLPKRSKALEPAIQSAPDDIEDPGATNLSYKLPAFASKNADQAQPSDIVDNFYETQAMGNILNKNVKPVPNVDLKTVEMSSLTSNDEDLKSTSVGMPVASYVTDNSKLLSPDKSEEYFPTVLTQPKPPESAEEQLRLLKELMEAGGESWKVPPPAPPPPSSALSTLAAPSLSSPIPSAASSAPTTEQTLSMAALPKPVETTSKSVEQTLISSSASKPSTAFDQTLNSAPAFSLDKKEQNPASIENFPLGPIPQTLTMKAAPKGKPEGEDFSYPNLEGPITSEEIMPETIQMQKPPSDSKDIASALNSWSSDVTSPWGTPAPSLSAPSSNPDAKTEALNNKAFSSPQQEKPKSKKDAFKTISVGPRIAKTSQPPKDNIPNNPLPPSSSFLDDIDPNKTAISTAYADMLQQEKPLANTAPMSTPDTHISEVTTEINAGISSMSTKASESSLAKPNQQQFISPTIPTPPINPTPDNVVSPPISNKRSVKIPLLLGIILVLVMSIIFIAWKLIENISSTPQTSATPSPSPVLSPVASQTPQTTTTPEPVTVAPPENMVLVPAGEYRVGSDSPGPDGDTFSSPQHTVKISAFYIDVYEVTNEEYSKFLQATAYPAPSNWQNGQYPGKAQDPVANVSWEDAQAYATWADKRLPTEEEWEIAASGQEHSLYPWGNEPDTKRTNSKEFGAKSVRTVGSVKTSKSSLGSFDMSGNVWEWTSSPAKAYPNAKEPKTTDPEKQRIFRGGSYQDKIEYCSTIYRGYESLTLTSPILGFRCAKDAPEQK